MAKILEVEKLNVSYNGLPILRDFSLDLNQGEILGIVGESGSGKSTLLKSMMGLLGDNGRIESGRISFDGTDLLRISKEELRKICGTRIGMVFQNPGMSFNPIRKIGKQFLEAMRSHGKVDEKQAKRQILDLFAKLGLRDGERILKSYPFELSGGMCQRVAIALAMVMNPEILLADEPTSALDVTVQAQCVKEMMDLREQLGTTIIIVTHNMGVVSHMADKIAVMYSGNLVEYGKKMDVLKNPQHPYTQALLKAIPAIGKRTLVGIPGTPPSFEETQEGCAFAPRCASANKGCTCPDCLTKKQYEQGHWALCPCGCNG